MALQISGGTWRVVFTGLITLATLFILGMMYFEHQQVEQCKERRREGDFATAAPVLPQIQPVNVIVRMPQVNKTEAAPKEETRNKWDYNWDKKAWANPEDAQGVGTRTLILVRHGQYHLDTGHLTDLGWQQANLTGLRLKQLNMPYKAIIHSTMDRARETAQAISRHLENVPVFSDDVIQEGGPIPPEPTISYWGLPQRTYFMEGPRLEAAFRKYFYRADKEQTYQSHEIIVGHGNIFRFLVLRALQFPPEAWMRVFIAHASITVLHINPDGTVNMNKFGDSGHFQTDMVTY